MPDCKGTDRGSHVMRVVTRNVWLSIHLTSRTSDHDALSLALLKEVWQPGAHVLNCSVCVLSFQLSCMMSLTILSSLRRS